MTMPAAEQEPTTSSPALVKQSIADRIEALYVSFYGHHAELADRDMPAAAEYFDAAQRLREVADNIRPT